MSCLPFDVLNYMCAFVSFVFFSPKTCFYAPSFESDESSMLSLPFPKQKICLKNANDFAYFSFCRILLLFFSRFSWLYHMTEDNFLYIALSYVLNGYLHTYFSIVNDPNRFKMWRIGSCVKTVVYEENSISI